jgi:hypothetical protein
MRLLLESKIGDLKIKYVDSKLISLEQFMKFTELDPSNKAASKPNKFVETMCKWYLNGSYVDDIVSVITSFHQKASAANFQGEKDINKYPTLESAQKVLDELTGETPKDPLKHVMYGLNKFPSESNLIAETKDRLYVNVETKEAMVFFGKWQRKWAQKQADIVERPPDAPPGGAERGANPWCIGRPPEDERNGNTNLWTNYKNKEKFVIFVQDKSDIDQAQVIQFNFKQKVLVPGNLAWTPRTNRTWEQLSYLTPEMIKKNPLFAEYFEVAQNIMLQIYGDQTKKIVALIEEKKFDELKNLIPSLLETQPVKSLVEYFYLLKDNSIECSTILLNAVFKNKVESCTDFLKGMFEAIMISTPAFKELMSKLLFATDAPKEHYELLLTHAKNLNVNIVDPKENTPLYAAVSNFKYGGSDATKYKKMVIEGLLNAGADPNITVNGKSLIEYAYHKASEVHDFALFHTLMNHGAKIELVSNPIAMINEGIEYEDYSFVKDLINKYNIDVTKTKPGVPEPLLFITYKYCGVESNRYHTISSNTNIEKDTFEMCKFLLEKGCNPIKPGTFLSCTPFEEALVTNKENQLNLLELFLKYTKKEDIVNNKKIMAIIESDTILPKAKEMVTKFLGESGVVPEESTVKIRKRPGARATKVKK